MLFNISNGVDIKKIHRSFQTVGIGIVESMRRGIRHPVARCVMMILQLYHRLRALWHKGCGPRCKKTSQFLSTRNPQSWLISHVMACVTLLGLNLSMNENSSTSAWIPSGNLTMENGHEHSINNGDFPYVKLPEGIDRRFIHVIC